MEGTKKLKTEENNIHVYRHALISHKMSILRDKNTPSIQVRQLITEIGLILATYATQHLDMIQIGKRQSQLQEYDAIHLKGQIALFPILRAGLGLVEAFHTMIPSARVHHLGLYREKTTLLPVEYYNKLPAECKVDVGFILDPMIATAGTAIATVNILKEWGLKKIIFICILSSAEGLKALKAAHPDIIIHVAQVDNGLNNLGYVLPGLGDAGDRLFSTLHD